VKKRHRLHRILRSVNKIMKYRNKDSKKCFKLQTCKTKPDHWRLTVAPWSYLQPCSTAPSTMQHIYRSDLGSLDQIHYLRTIHYMVTSENNIIPLPFSELTSLRPILTVSQIRRSIGHVFAFDSDASIWHTCLGEPREYYFKSYSRSYSSRRESAPHVGMATDEMGMEWAVFYSHPPKVCVYPSRTSTPRCTSLCMQPS